MYINRKEKKISISAEEMLAPMVYYFGEVDAVDFSLLSDYIIQRIKEKYQEYEINVIGIKDAYSYNFLFHRTGETTYEKVYTNDTKRSNKLSSANYGVKVGQNNYILCYISDTSITVYGHPLHIDIIRLWDLKYKELLKQIDRDDDGNEIFNIISKFVGEVSKKTYYEEKRAKLESMYLTIAKYLDTIDINGSKIYGLNILLISSDEKDYNVLIKLGFKNITWFKSVIRAKEYFEQNPDELKNYHIIFEGDILFDSCVAQNDDPDRKFMEKCRGVCKKNGTLFFRFYCSESKENIGEFKIFTSEETIKSASGVKQHFTFNKYRDNGGYVSLSESEFLEKMAELLVIKWPDGKVPTLEFNEVKEYINPNLLPYPHQLSDIKILAILADEDFTKLSEKYGLNIETPETLFAKGIIKPSSDNPNEYNYRDFYAWLKENLGEYDIIIIDDTNYYSRNLRIRESIEQCKDTGRQLTLFIKLSDGNLSYKDSYDHATELILKYEYGGINVLPSTSNRNKRKVVRLFHREENDYNKKEHQIAEYTIIASVYKYCELLEEVAALKRLGYSETTNNNCQEVYEEIIGFYGPPSIQLPLPTPETLTRTYDIASEEAWQEYRAKQERDSTNYELINNFDEARNIVKKYLNYVRREIPINSPEGIEISETEEEIEVRFLNTHDNNRPIGTIIFEKNEPRTGLRNINIRTLNNSGRLSGDITRLSIYTSSWEGKDGIYPRPNTRESEIIAAHITRICAELSPLIAAAEDARKKEKRHRRRARQQHNKKTF